MLPQHKLEPLITLGSASMTIRPRSWSESISIVRERELNPAASTDSSYFPDCTDGIIKLPVELAAALTPSPGLSGRSSKNADRIGTPPESTAWALTLCLPRCGGSAVEGSGDCRIWPDAPWHNTAAKATTSLIPALIKCYRNADYRPLIGTARWRAFRNARFAGVIGKALEDLSPLFRTKEKKAGARSPPRKVLILAISQR